MVEAPRRVEVEDEEEGSSFFKDLGKQFIQGATYGVARGASQEVARQLINKPLERRRLADEVQQANFVNSQQIATDINDANKTYKLMQELVEAQRVHKETGIPEDLARVQVMTSLQDNAIASLQANPVFKDEAFTRQEQLEIANDAMLKQARLNAPIYDKLLATIKDAPTGDALKTSALVAYRNSQGGLGGAANKVKSFITKQTPRDFAMQAYRNTPEYQNLMEAREIIDQLNDDPENDNKLLRKLKDLTLGDIDDKFFKVKSIEKKLSKKGDGTVEVTKTTIQDLVNDVTTSKEEEVPNSYRDFVSPKEALQDLNALAKSLFSMEKTRVELNTEIERLVNAKFPQGIINEDTGKRERFNMSSALSYRNSDGILAQSIAQQTFSKYLRDPTKVIDMSKEQLESFKLLTKAQSDLQANYNIISKTLATKFRREGRNIIALDGKGKDLVDQNSEKAQGIRSEVRQAEAEYRRIANAISLNKKRLRGVKFGFIEVKSVNVVNSDGTVSQETMAGPTGFIGYDEKFQAFDFPPDFSEEQKDERTERYGLWLSGRMSTVEREKLQNINNNIKK